MMASKAMGVRELLDVVEDVLAGKRVPHPHLPEVRADHQEVLREIERLITRMRPRPLSAQLGGA